MKWAPLGGVGCTSIGPGAGDEGPHRGIDHLVLHREQAVTLPLAMVNHLLNEQKAGEQDLYNTKMSSFYTNRHLNCLVRLYLVPLGVLRGGSLVLLRAGSIFYVTVKAA